MTQNRRSTYRHSVTLPGRLTVDEETHEVTVYDLSRGGAMLTFGHRLTLGHTVQILFHIPTRDEPIDVRAAVRWSNHENLGVSFLGLGPGDVWALNKYFESLESTD